MRFWPLIPALLLRIKNRERCAASFGGYRYGVSGRGLGQANLVRAFDVTRAIVGMLTGLLFVSSLASAQNGTPSPRPNDEFSFMQLLAGKGLHDLENESWNAYGQFTYISSWKPSFSAPYTDLNGSNNSLLPTAERSFTGTATLYVGLRLWNGAEAYAVPEVISEQALSQLRGLGGAIQNFELQKGERLSLSSIIPVFSSSRQSDWAVKASWRNQVPCNWEPATTAGDWSSLPAISAF